MMNVAIHSPKKAEHQSFKGFQVITIKRSEGEYADIFIPNGDLELCRKAADAVNAAINGVEAE